ncbi:hypothetical protein NEOLI_005049 [Neolecta irregularis DAH-3]|uniref:Uncharacterized protein n=1 Tax=Neolecta irregularis (strain DAH-3) TaxID=1198029 RepID=A0A1U7LJJ5_NEOID|nr:hypothetical protein NEOLI_005049 [Neolecta irregularis DAH-3]|eukprot:OLL22763.1 hypothetical protein NEOLI_005049 [Neolecta irregularis DAH-3]
MSLLSSSELAGPDSSDKEDDCRCHDFWYVRNNLSRIPISSTARDEIFCQLNLLENIQRDTLALLGKHGVLEFGHQSFADDSGIASSPRVLFPSSPGYALRPISLPPPSFPIDSDVREPEKFDTPFIENPPSSPLSRLTRTTLLPCKRYFEPSPEPYKRVASSPRKRRRIDNDDENANKENIGPEGYSTPSKRRRFGRNSILEELIGAEEDE